MCKLRLLLTRKTLSVSFCCSLHGSVATFKASAQYIRACNISSEPVHLLANTEGVRRFGVNNTSLYVDRLQTSLIVMLHSLRHSGIVIHE